MKTLIFGNSGSGKSTLASRLSKQDGIAHLDLDTIAWQNVVPPKRADIDRSRSAIERFVQLHSSWVIEGCYADLLELAAGHATHVIFLNLPVEACMDNARKRPWEPHKYASQEQQDKNLPMLIEWIGNYETRDDTFSKKAHLKVFDEFMGEKTQYVANLDLE